MIATFARLPPRMQEAIVSRLGWTSLRPVQEEAGAALLDGCNAIILAPTAGGKTEAAMFFVLADLMERPPSAVGALYLAPIKALLNNQAERLGTYTEMVGLRRFLWHGDTTQAERRRFLKEPAELLMTTPESLEVMLLSPRVPHARLFADLRAVVIDEVHALAGSDRGAHLMAVLQRLGRFSRHDVQRVGLSATVGNPHDILTWLSGPSRRPGRVVDPPRPPGGREIAVRYCPTEEQVARAAAGAAQGQKSLFFCQSRALTESVAQRLRGRGIDVFVHHSSVSLEERQAAEHRFHHGSNALIACTSTLELGIDVGDLDRVFQADAPSTVSSFLQRMGRTGRRSGQRANTMFLCTDPEVVLQAAAIVELAREGRVESVRPQTRCWPVLVHQLLALCLQYGGISPERCWDELKGVPDFSGITRAEVDELIDHMLTNDYLFSSGGLLSMGQHAERVFGRKNFIEIYAVFSTPQLYRVAAEGGKDIGSLEQSFVDKLVAEMSSFLLGGRPWLVREVFHRERLVKVAPAPAGMKPTWAGYVPQFLGYELCRKMHQLATSETPLPYLDQSAAAALATLRHERASHRGLAVEVGGEDELVWTYAGGAVNQTLKYGLGLLHGWSVASDNFRLRIRRSDDPKVEDSLRQLARPELWEEPDFQDRLLKAMPEYRLSKFQDALPRRRTLEVVREYLIDLPRTLSFLREVLP
ncbi:MAG: ATP-dependent helicase [Candidatus Xenobia bacterium]